MFSRRTREEHYRKSVFLDENTMQDSRGDDPDSLQGACMNSLRSRRTRLRRRLVTASARAATAIGSSKTSGGDGVCDFPIVVVPCRCNGGVGEGGGRICGGVGVSRADFTQPRRPVVPPSRPERRMASPRGVASRPTATSQSTRCVTR